MATSAKPLFRATKAKRKVHPAQTIIGNLPEQRAPEALRDPLDFDPTPWDATAAFLDAERPFLRPEDGPVWENAVGAGHIAGELARAGFDVVGTDIVDRGWPGTDLRSFYDVRTAPARRVVSNPPYGEITTKGQGRWLRHLFDLDLDYIALLLSWEWMAGRVGGLDALHAEWPVSRVYLCCWKIDFRGQGNPAQRNAWHVWDKRWSGETVLRRLFRERAHEQQEGLF